MNAREALDPGRALPTPVAVALEKLTGFYRGIRQRPIGPLLDQERRAGWLDQYRFDSPVPLAELTAEVADALANGNLLSAHPRCFGLFNPTPDPAGIVADLLASGFNPQLAVSSHAPMSVEIERHVIRAVAKLIWPDRASGHFTSGGAEANMTALLLALTAANRGFAQEGARAFVGPPVFFASAESHFAWFKIAHQLGIGRKAVRLVPTDGTGRMAPPALTQAIVAARDAGDFPVAVMATAGTTGAGMVDPLDQIAAIACEEGLWFHVDAAWAGALVAVPDKRDVLRGIDQADSVTIDAHKWFNAPMGAGMFFCRHPERLAESFNVQASYMPGGDGDDPYVRTAQWSRRNIGLRLFMILAAHGWAGVAARIREQLRLAEQLRTLLQANGWQLENDSPCAVVAFNDARGAPAEAIVEHVQGDGKCWLSLAKLEGRSVVRACLTSALTTTEDLGVLIESLAGARDRACRHDV